MMVFQRGTTRTDQEGQLPQYPTSIDPSVEQVAPDEAPEVEEEVVPNSALNKDRLLEIIAGYGVEGYSMKTGKDELLAVVDILTTSEEEE